MTDDHLISRKGVSMLDVNQIYLAELREIFSDLDKIDFTLNWLFLSTSGVHGSYATLDDMEQWEPEEPGAKRCITVLVIKPRVLSLLYGHIEIDEEDIPWMREAIRRTLAGIAESQQGNT